MAKEEWPEDLKEMRFIKDILKAAANRIRSLDNPPEARSRLAYVLACKRWKDHGRPKMSHPRRSHANSLHP
jgi:hypothetical protein